MIEYNGFNGDGKWFKGNMHCHTANSDGRLSQKEVARLYKEEGYNFLVFTDHNRFTDTKEYDDDNFITIPGIEVDTAQQDPLRIYHSVGLQDKGKYNTVADGEKFSAGKWSGTETAQNMIDSLKSKGMLAFFCHPIWSRLELEDFIDIEGYFALEIFNYGCSIESNTGLSVDYWDSLLRRGRQIWAVATDDCHHRINDRFGGYVMVNAPELTKDAIVDSLIKGAFYSSSGPEIYKYTVENGTVQVQCSPARAIHFVTYEPWGHSCLAEKNGTITSAGYKLNGREKYVRVECVDAAGRTAWTNPIFLK